MKASQTHNWNTQQADDDHYTHSDNTARIHLTPKLQVKYHVMKLMAMRAGWQLVACQNTFNLLIFNETNSTVKLQNLIVHEKSAWSNNIQ